MVRARQEGAVLSTYKDATELVTTADTRSDAAISRVLAARLPTIDPAISFHLEESGFSGAQGAKRVGANPLDGTSHFVAGGSLYRCKLTTSKMACR